MTFLLAIIVYLCGSLMFSYWLGVYTRKNIRKVGDGNPGAANLWKAAGYKYGIAGVFLDFLKGYLPLYLIIKSHIVVGYELIPIALAPILGHAFSPFLKFKGGKAIAVTFAVWAALTKFEVTIAYAIISAILQAITRAVKKGQAPSAVEDSFLTVFGLLLVPLYLYIRNFPVNFEWIWLGNILILLYTNQKHLVIFFKNRFKRSTGEQDKDQIS